MTPVLIILLIIVLAVGFGLQGFVEDVVIGLTLIFSDALTIGEIVKLGDEIGKVDSIGLRFTKLINLHGQRIIIPNRNIATISQFRGGCIRACIDIQLAREIDAYLEAVDPESVDELKALILPHAGYRYSGMVAAHGAKLIAGRTFKRVFVLGPSHRVALMDLCWSYIPLAIA